LQPEKQQKKMPQINPVSPIRIREGPWKQMIYRSDPLDNDERWTNYVQFNQAFVGCQIRLNAYVFSGQEQGEIQRRIATLRDDMDGYRAKLANIQATIGEEWNLEQLPEFSQAVFQLYLKVTGRDVAPVGQEVPVLNKTIFQIRDEIKILDSYWQETWMFIATYPERETDTEELKALRRNAKMIVDTWVATRQRIWHEIPQEEPEDADQRDFVAQTFGWIEEYLEGNVRPWRISWAQHINRQRRYQDVRQFGPDFETFYEEIPSPSQRRRRRSSSRRRSVKRRRPEEYEY